MKRQINVLELFSGIGGMHYALKEAQKVIPNLEFEVKLAIDISDVANQVYKHNFPGVECKGSNICGLTPEKLNKLGIEAIFMSPPCQPFTRQGNQKDVCDNRSMPLIHITNELIPKVTGLNYVLVENVKGFECSLAHELLLQSLKSSGFRYQEYLICPKQLGVPNSRLRYYLIASKSGSFAQRDELITEVDEDVLQIFARENKGLEEYLNDPADPFEKEDLELGSKILEKHAEVLDIVSSTSKGSCCFTKSYGKFAEGTGSVLQQMGNLDEVFEAAAKASDLQERLDALKVLKLRYFSPVEVAKLMGFPSHFTFPQPYLKKPILCYRVLGNSLNVTVVAMLATILLRE